MPHDITRLYRNIRVTGDIRERTPCKKTPINSYSKLKIRIRIRLNTVKITFIADF